MSRKDGLFSGKYNMASVITKKNYKGTIDKNEYRDRQYLFRSKGMSFWISPDELTVLSYWRKEKKRKTKHERHLSVDDLYYREQSKKNTRRF